MFNSSLSLSILRQLTVSDVPVLLHGMDSEFARLTSLCRNSLGPSSSLAA